MLFFAPGPTPRFISLFIGAFHASIWAIFVGGTTGMGIRRQDLLQPGTEGLPGGCPWHSEFSLSLSLWYWCWKHVVVWLVLELERLSGVDGWMGGWAKFGEAWYAGGDDSVTGWGGDNVGVWRPAINNP